MTSRGPIERAVTERMAARPGDPLLLHDGPLALSRPGREPALADGRIWLGWREGASLLWSAGTGPDWDEQRARRVTGGGNQALSLDWHGLTGRADTWLTETGRGWMNEMTLGDPQAPVDRVLASWVSMPSVRRRPGSGPDGSPGGGRWEFDADGWRISIVPRDDLHDVLADCRRERLFAVTHTMTLRRTDGRSFPAARADAALAALHMAVSFAAGRWTCPAGPVGIDAAGAAVWAHWAPLHCDHAGPGSTGWWAPEGTDDLEAVIRAFLAAAPDGDDGWSTLHYLATASVIAGESGFVEQRLVLAAASLEHLVWTTDVLEGNYSRTSFDKGDRSHADERLRQHLAGIGVPLTVDPDRTPALAAYAARQDRRDGPSAVLAVRNALAHPKTPSGLYKHPGLITEAARLACRYLDLGILHRIGYTGRVRDRTKVTGWAGDTEPVPWAG